MAKALTGIADKRRRNAKAQAKLRAERDAKGLCRTCRYPAKRVLLSAGPRGERRYKILRQCKRCLRKDADRHLTVYPLELEAPGKAPRKAPATKAPRKAPPIRDLRSRLEWESDL